MSLEEVGEVRHSDPYVIDWTIPSFSLLCQKKGTRIWSPPFVHCGMSGVSMPGITTVGFPMTVRIDGYIELNFYSKDGKEAPVQCVRFGIEDINNSIFCCCDKLLKEGFSNARKFKIAKFVRTDFLNQHQHTSFVQGPPRFRLFCEVLDSQICQMINASTQTDNRCGLRKLGQNLEELFFTGKHSDMLIKVKDREFNVHKAILTARSTVFDKMFSHNLSETNSGIVPIEDCEPSVFEGFLLFVYTGRTHNLSSDNACELYYVADKYDLPEMKEECIRFLKKSLTIDTICDVICMATKYNETELLDIAVTFFARNMEEIILTNKWLLFMKENPVEANELTIKALKLGFTKRKI